MTNKNNILMRKRGLDDAISPEFTQQIHEAFSRLSRRLRAVDLPYSLTNERLSTLVTVGVHEPVSISALADAEVMSRPTMSRMVAILEAEGLVKRQENKYGRREILVSTTAKGKRHRHRHRWLEPRPSFQRTRHRTAGLLQAYRRDNHQ